MSQSKENKTKEDSTPIIVKKIKKGGHGHHGGAWKIAYADFVTAMMAFFLLMWLLASLNKAQKEGLADYFKQPIKVSLFQGNDIGNRVNLTAGGGDNLARQEGQVSANNKPTIDQKNTTEQGKKKDQVNEKDELEELKRLKSNINLAIEDSPSLSGLKDRLRMSIEQNGLQIQMVDSKKKAMFEIGSDKMDPEVKKLLSNIAGLLNKLPNKITIQGHTDAHPYDNPDELEYTNWELSTQRANAARRALIKGGLNPNKVLRVAGYADTLLLDKANPNNPNNRRISIIVMKQRAADAILNGYDKKTVTPATAKKPVETVKDPKNAKDTKDVKDNKNTAKIIDKPAAEKKH